MKVKSGMLLIVLGGVLFGTLNNLVSGIPWIFISLIGGFMIGFSFMLFTSIYSGTVWGIKVSAPFSSKIKSLIGIVGLVFGGFSLIYTFLALVNYLFSGRILELLLNLVVYVAAFIAGPFVAKKYLEKDLAKSQSANAIGELDIFKEIDENLQKATDFVVGFEGVALFSQTNYCYAVYLYEDYQLGQLSTPEEVALVGTYFVQKYSDKFTFKVDMEVIPGTPGETVVAVGMGGVGVARIQGVPDKAIFRSYIFKRKAY